MNRPLSALKSFLLPGALLLIALIILAALPSFGSKYSIIFLSTVFMYIVLTTGWVMFSGPTRQISLATAVFFGIGIYVAAILGKQMPLLVMVCIGGLTSSVMALLVGSLTLRLKGVYFTIFTFGLLELIKNAINWYEVTFTGTRGRFVVVVDNNTIYFYMLAITALTLLTAFLIRRSKYGLALQSIGEQEEAAAHIGINVTLMKVSIFAISAFFMGAAGAVMATRWTYIDPFMAFNMNYSFTPVLMAIFGGIGQLSGVAVGAIIFAYLEQILITKYPFYYMLLFGIVMVISVVFLPNGLAGLVQKWRARIAGGRYARA
ncbi:MAG TPA: branched-chain amino acid ABC transporter permease [Anaerolineales bacterium]|nr:branched-chain amino acid ABC transporter permease [Anaerolineales bacterium]